MAIRLFISPHGNQTRDKACLPRPPSLGPTGRVPIQPVEHGIEVNGLTTLFEPLDHAHHMIAPEPHAHQLLYQFIVRMVARELWRASHHVTATTHLRIRRVRPAWWKMGLLGQVLRPSPFTLVHHIRIP